MKVNCYWNIKLSAVDRFQDSQQKLKSAGSSEPSKHVQNLNL